MFTAQDIQGGNGISSFEKLDNFFLAELHNACALEVCG